MMSGLLPAFSEPVIQSLTEVRDTDYRVNVTDRVVLYKTLILTRTVTLPPAALFGMGFLTIADNSGQAASSRQIQIFVSGKDVFIDPTSTTSLTQLNISGTNQGLQLFSDGVSRWSTVGILGGLAGDLQGSLIASTSQQVIGWRGIGLGALMGAPSDQDLPHYDVATSAWQPSPTLPSSQFPAWQNWTPVVVQGANTPTLTLNTRRYIQFGSFVAFLLRVTPTSIGVAGSAVTVTLPVTAATSAHFIGGGQVILAGTAYRVGVFANATTTMAFKEADVTTASNMGVLPNAALAASGDSINVFGMYEAA